MENPENIKKERFYSEVYDAIWNQYLYLTSIRERLEHKFEIILVLVSIYLAVFFQLKIYEIHPLNYIPLFIGFSIFLLTLYRVIPIRITVPWVEKNDFDSYENSEKVHKQLIDECYEHIKDIRALEKDEKCYLKIIILLLLFSVLFPVIPIILAFNFSLFVSSTVISVVIFIFIIILEIEYYKKFDNHIRKDRIRID